MKAERRNRGKGVRSVSGGSNSPGGSNVPVGSSSASQEKLDLWERFWFAPHSSQSLGPARWLLSLAAVYFALSFSGELTSWFARDGVLSTERLGRLVSSTGVEGAARWQFSLLYGASPPWVLRLVAATIALGALGVGFGIGGRWLLALVWVGCISLANREWFLAGPGELALAAGLLSLWVATPGRWSMRVPPAPRPLVGLGRRMLQVHGVTMILGAVAIQFSSGAWFTGEGIIRVMSSHPYFRIDLTSWFLGTSLGQVADGIVVLLPLLGIGLILFSPSHVRWGVALMGLYCLLVASLSGNVLLGLAWGGMIAAFLPGPSPREEEIG